MKKFIVMLKDKLSDKNENGFSLLELVVAIGILLVLTVGGLIGYNSISQNSVKAATETAATDALKAAVVFDTDGDDRTDPLSVDDTWNGSAGSDVINVQIRRGSEPGEFIAIATHNKKDYQIIKSNKNNNSGNSEDEDEDYDEEENELYYGNPEINPDGSIRCDSEYEPQYTFEGGRYKENNGTDGDPNDPFWVDYYDDGAMIYVAYYTSDKCIQGEKIEGMRVFAVNQETKVKTEGEILGNNIWIDLGSDNVKGNYDIVVEGATVLSDKTKSLTVEVGDNGFFIVERGSFLSEQFLVVKK